MIDLTFLRTLSLKEKDKTGFQFSTEERARTIEQFFFHPKIFAGFNFAKMVKITKIDPINIQTQCGIFNRKRNDKNLILKYNVDKASKLLPIGS